jgi:hypothetical protein
MIRAGTWGLGGLAILLAGTIAMQWQAPAPEPIAARGPASPPHATFPGPGTADENLRAELVATALERPLFTASRRPPAGAAVTAPAIPAALPRLAGVMIGPFGRRAIFAAPDGGKPLVVQAGDSVEDFRVQSIEDGMVTLQSADRTLRLRPSFATAAGGPSTNLATTPDMPSGLPPGILPEDLANPPTIPGRRP